MIQRQYYAYNKKTKRLVCSVRALKDENGNVTYFNTESGDPVKDSSLYFIKNNMYAVVYGRSNNNDTTIREQSV